MLSAGLGRGSRALEVRDDLLVTCLASYGEICAALTVAGIRANHGLIKVLDHIEVAIVARDV